MLHVKQTTTTLASFRSPRLISLPSTPGRPLNSGACAPISNSAEYAVAQRAAKASTKKLRRSMSKLLVETKGVLAKSACKQAAKTDCLSYGDGDLWFASSIHQTSKPFAVGSGGA